MRNSAKGMLWIGAAAIGGFLVTFILADRLRVARDWFVLGHLVVTGSMLGAYIRCNPTTWRELTGDWWSGLIGAAVAGAMMIGFVLVGPTSPAPVAWAFAWAIIWLGVVYGTIDALLLSVFPVVSTRWIGGSDLLAKDGKTKVISLVGLGVSLVLTITYHLGFPEFRGHAMISPLIGNGIMTLSYLATRSAVSPVLAHIALHIAAVTYGYLNALPAPPHY